MDNKYNSMSKIIEVIKTGDREQISGLYTRKAVLFNDVDGFTNIVKSKGIEYFLVMIYEATQILQTLLPKYNARLIKVDGDSHIIVSDTVSEGLSLITGYTYALKTNPATRELSFNWGVGYGDIIEMERNLFGMEVNLAAKIGEDVADNGQVLITQNAASQINNSFTLAKHSKFGFNYYEVLK